MAELCHWTCDLRNGRERRREQVYIFRGSGGHFWPIARSARSHGYPNSGLRSCIRKTATTPREATRSSSMERPPATQTISEWSDPMAKFPYVREVADKLYGPDGKTACRWHHSGYDRLEKVRIVAATDQKRNLQRAYRLAKLGYWYWEASDTAVGMEEGSYRFRKTSSTSPALQTEQPGLDQWP